MTTAELEAFVARLDEGARRNPAGYKSRVVLLALLGYGYVGSILLILLLLTLVAFASIVYLKVVGLKIALVLLFFLILVVKAMFVKLEAPAGRALTRRESPALFATIDALRNKLGAPRFHHVLLTNDFNAAVVQVPRLGLLGWHRNYLLLGLPLLQSLAPAQFEAVLAHELGHLAGGHAALSNWIYRLRMGWQRLVAVLEHNRSWGSFMFRPFFNWYAPYFGAYSFPLARLNEYEADAASARLTSSQAAAEALTAVNVIGLYLNQKFWPEIHKQAEHLPQPAFAPYSKIGTSLASELAATSTAEWLSQAMKQETSVADTHPSFSDRLSALKQQPSLVPPGSGAGADTLLGAARESITAELDRHWHEAIRPVWEKRFQEMQQARTRLGELDESGAARELTVDEAFEHAKLAEACGAGADAALEEFRAVHAREPGRPVFAFALAHRLLARDDAAGLALMERTMQLDQDAIASGCEAIRDFHWRAGRKTEAYTWQDRFAERQDLEHKAMLERNDIRTNDKFTTHDLPAETIDKLRAEFAAIPELRKVYLIRKRVQYRQDRPLYLCAFIITPWWKKHNAKRAAEIQRQLLESVRFPGETLVLSAEGKNYQFGRKFRGMRGSRVV